MRRKRLKLGASKKRNLSPRKRLQTVLITCQTTIQIKDGKPRSRKLP